MDDQRRMMGQIQDHRRRVDARPGERGSALVLSLVLVTVCATLGAAFTTLAASNARAQSHAVAQLKAFYAAEAGLAEAFVAVRMGRSGDIASAAEPAAFGTSEVFVRAFEDEEHRVHLLAKGLSGRSEAILGQVVLPPEPPLGFFAFEDLVVDGRILVDGFNGDRQGYDAEVSELQADQAESQQWSDAQLATFESARETAAPIVDAMGERAFRQMLEEQVLSDPARGTALLHAPIDPRDHLDEADYTALIADLEDIASTHAAGMLFIQESGGLLGAGGLLGTGLLAGDGGGSAPPAPLTHTVHGGQLGSNGDITFTDTGAGTEVHGNVTPGPGRSVAGEVYADISGSTLTRTEAAHVHEVVAPDYASQGPLAPAGYVPAVLSNERVRHDDVTVAAGQELVLRGPLELVAADLRVEAGASLTIDTSDGDVTIILTGSLHIDPGAVVQSNALRSEEVSIRATGHDALATELVLAAPMEFHGTIKAPRSHVHVAAAFEVFGSITARTMTLADGARLHFDSATYDAALEMPRPDSWRIISLPGGPTADRPAKLEGREKIAAAPIKDDVMIAIEFIDSADQHRVYKGAESVLDYSLVKRVLYAERYLVAASPREPADADITIGRVLESTLDALGL